MSEASAGLPPEPLHPPESFAEFAAAGETHSRCALHTFGATQSSTDAHCLSQDPDVPHLYGVHVVSAPPAALDV